MCMFGYNFFKMLFIMKKQEKQKNIYIKNIIGLNFLFVIKNTKNIENVKFK